MFVREIAENKEKWDEYVNPGNDDPGAFERLTTPKKMALIVGLWPEDIDQDDTEAWEILAKQKNKG